VSPEGQLLRISTATADYGDSVAIRAAFRGVDTLVFVSSDGEAAQVVLHHQNVIRAAAHSGVTHIVALSGLDADLSSPFCYAVTNGHTERLLLDSGCSISIARASLFTEFFMGLLLQARRSGQIRVPGADGQVSLVSRTDVGRCLAALAVAPPTGRHHDLTGPEALDFAAIAALSEHAWGMPIEYVDITPAEYCVELARAGEDPWWMYAYSTMFESVRQQRWASVSEEVFRLTGRPPRSVHDVLSEWRATSAAG
jgi:NAD(P)H dehydrogenase (quinone)